MHSNFQTFRFAIIITLTCSLLLAAAATLLKPRQQENVKLDIKKNILKSAGITKPEQQLSRQEIQKLYAENIEALVIDTKGDVVEGKTPESIDPKKDHEMYPVYEWKSNGQINAFIIPISGKGLWSTIYGYLAIEPDGSTIRGITFYQHGETPGLGGEIEKQWFTDNYIGKRIVNDEGKLVSVSVVRGKVKDKIAEDEQYHYVDGISGATLTGRGVDNFMKEDLKTYEPFFLKIRGEKKGDING